MAVIAVKILLAPLFVVGASLVARRFGPRVGGLAGALPVAAGPALLVYALQHGDRFAGDAASGALLGLVSLTGFLLAYGHLSRRVGWLGCLLCGWLVYIAMIALLSVLTLPAGAELTLACVTFACGVRLLPAAAAEPSPPTAPPGWDLPLRAGCALALVLALTAVAGWLGPQLSGLLTPFPVVAAVLTTFTHAQCGERELLRMLRGLLIGYGAFALFCFALTESLVPLGTAWGFALASAAAVSTQALVLPLSRRRAPTVVVADLDVA